MGKYLDIYWANFKSSLLQQMQYRVANLLWIIAMIVEPVIYLVVWQTVAREQGGTVGGYTPGDFAGYYIVWTLVRHMNIALTPYEFEDRIQRGTLSPMLMRPIHPFHMDLGGFFGMKIVPIFIWMPVAAVLWYAFQPTIHPAPWQVAAFAVAIVTGFLMRFVLLWALGLATFWITKVSALFEAYFGAEIFLSGRMVPIALLPSWMQTISAWLPYQWAFGFPIELGMGKITKVEVVLFGFGMQALWTLIGAILLTIMWRAGVKKYSAVGA